MEVDAPSELNNGYSIDFVVGNQRKLLQMATENLPIKLLTE